MNEERSTGVRARLFCRTGERAGEEFFIGREATVGSSRENHVQLDASGVAARQIRLSYSDDEEAYVVENLGPDSGVTLDGRPLSRRRRLSDLHVIGFPGGHDYIFQELSGEVEVGEETAGDVAVPAAPASILDEARRQPSQRSEPETVAEELGPMPSVFAEDKADAPEEGRKTEAAAPEKDEEEEQTQADRAIPSLPDFERTREEADQEAADQEEKEARPKPSETPTDQTRVQGTIVTRRPRPDSKEAPEPRGGEGERSGFLLMVSEEGGTAHSYPLKLGKNLVGRMNDCDIVLTHRAVSRRQVSLLVEPARVIASDLGGINRTLLDGEPFQGEVEVRPGQELSLGPFKASLVASKKGS